MFTINLSAVKKKKILRKLTAYQMYMHIPPHWCRRNTVWWEPDRQIYKEI